MNVNATDSAKKYHVFIIVDQFYGIMERIEFDTEEEVITFIADENREDVDSIFYGENLYSKFVKK